MDNLDPNAGNPDPIVPAAPVTPPAAPPAGAFSWKSNLPADFANSPSMLKYPDTKEGFAESVRSHLELERLLGYEKVPIPKGKDDAAAWAVFSKAMGIPDKPEGYALPDVQLPESLNGKTFDKARFSALAHKQRLTPEATKGLWADYTEAQKEIYAKAQDEHKQLILNNMNQLKGEWGEAYQAKVETGQMVLNKFCTSTEMNDKLTAMLTSDPDGIRFLSIIGDQFSENKIGDFKYQRHSLTPDEAQNEWDAIRADMSHPYNNEKAPKTARDAAIARVNELIGIAKRPRG